MEKALHTNKRPNDVGTRSSVSIGVGFTSGWRWFFFCWFVGLCGLVTASAQDFSISTAGSGNGLAQIGFPSRADSYYLLHSNASLSMPFTPVDAVLGSGDALLFKHSISPAGAAFFRVEQLPLTATNDILGDGIPDAFKLQNGLPVFGPSQATVVPTNDTRTWLEIYQETVIPIVSFAQPGGRVLEGQGVVSIPLQLSKPLSSFVTYTYSGSAVAGLNGDYRLPSGVVSVSGTTATINLTLLDDLIAKPPRTIILTLNPDTATPPRYLLGNTAACFMVIEDNDALWEGQINLGPLSFSIQMNIAQQGSIYQATVNGGNSYFPSGTWPVSLTVTSNTFNAVVGPVQSGSTASVLNTGFSRYLYLNAPLSLSTQGVLAGATVISGSVGESLVFSDSASSYLNRTNQGTFTLQRTDANAPSTLVPLTHVGP